MPQIPFYFIFFPFYHVAVFPCLGSTCHHRTVKCVESTEQKVEEALFRIK